MAAVAVLRICRLCVCLCCVAYIFNVIHILITIIKSDRTHTPVILLYTCGRARTNLNVIRPYERTLVATVLPTFVSARHHFYNEQFSKRSLKRKSFKKLNAFFYIFLAAAAPMNQLYFRCQYSFNLFRPQICMRARLRVYVIFSHYARAPMMIDFFAQFKKNNVFLRTPGLQKKKEKQKVTYVWMRW